MNLIYQNLNLKLFLGPSFPILNEECDEKFISSLHACPLPNVHVCSEQPPTAKKLNTFSCF